MKKELTIGNIKLANPLILAPMVDVTDLPYRLICRKAGASLAYTEMLYVSAILHENDKTKMLMKVAPSEKPVGIQITGNTPEEFKDFIPYSKPYHLIDINCGCPSIRITGNQAGSFLLKSPEKIASMIKILKKSGKPVTAKIRLGFKENNVIKVARMIEKAGADALTVHARLASQSGKTPADWQWIAKVKKELGIPVIGNGDINSGEQAQKMLDIADGAMIARAAIGDPMIFSRIQKYLLTGKEPEFDFKANIKLLNDYIQLAIKHKVVDVHRIKQIAPNFLRNQPGVAKLRHELMQKKTIEEISEFTKRLF